VTRRLVRVRFNGEERLLAAGLTVRSLLTEAQVQAVQRGELTVRDARGHERGLGGALADGADLALVPRAQR
jgi:aconitase B